MKTVNKRKWLTDSLRSQAYQLRKKHGWSDEEIRQHFYKTGKMVDPLTSPHIEKKLHTLQAAVNNLRIPVNAPPKQKKNYPKKITLALVEQYVIQGLMGGTVDIGLVNTALKLIQVRENIEPAQTHSEVEQESLKSMSIADLLDSVLPQSAVTP